MEVRRTPLSPSPERVSVSMTREDVLAAVATYLRTKGIMSFDSSVKWVGQEYVHDTRHVYGGQIRSLNVTFEQGTKR